MRKARYTTYIHVDISTKTTALDDRSKKRGIITDGSGIRDFHSVLHKKHISSRWQDG
jgi:hypothetical protein